MTSANKDTPNLITNYINKMSTLGTQKQPRSTLSPVEAEHQNKKANMDKGAPESTEDMNLGNLKSLLVPLMEKVDQLRESVDNKNSKIE